MCVCVLQCALISANGLALGTCRFNGNSILLLVGSASACQHQGAAAVFGVTSPERPFSNMQRFQKGSRRQKQATKRHKTLIKAELAGRGKKYINERNGDSWEGLIVIPLAKRDLVHAPH